MPPVGRPPAERNVYSFDGALVPPEELVLETSFVVDALVPTQQRHAICSAFLQTIVHAESRVIYNRFLEAELWETAYRIALKELHPGRRAADLRHDRRTLRRAQTLRQEVETAWKETLTTLDFVSVDLRT